MSGGLFKVTAPIVIHCRTTTEKSLVAEKYIHPQGLLWFEPFWFESPESRVHLAAGHISGEGPWRVGDFVLSVAGCHATDAQLAMSLAEWQEFLSQVGDEYPDYELSDEIARQSGVLEQNLYGVSQLHNFD